MENDNVYPKDGRFYAPGNAVVDKKSEEEEALVLEQVPVLKQMLEHLDEQIALLTSVDFIDEDITALNSDKFQQIMAANKLARDKLRIERTYLLAQIDKIKKR